VHQIYGVVSQVVNKLKLINMFTATIKNKEDDGGAVKFFVEFTDGEKTVTEWCIPQNEEGFNYWVQSRLEVFNSCKDLSSKLEKGTEITIVNQIENTPTVFSKEEQEKNDWFVDYAKFTRIKTNLVDNGILSESDESFLELSERVKKGYKQEYFETL
jgi:hypothetical protein